MTTIWFEADQEAALAQGWGLFEFHTTQNGLETQLQCWGDDPTQRFAESGDAGVWEHVVAGAMRNPPDFLCAKALRYLQEVCPSEHERVIKHAQVVIGNRR